jgi:cysteine synthase A
LNTQILDEIITVEDDAAYETAQRLAYEEGLLVGISAGAACYAALQVAKRLGPHKQVVFICPDRGERYFSLKRYFRAGMTELRDLQVPPVPRLGFVQPRGHG